MNVSKHGNYFTWKQSPRLTATLVHYSLYFKEDYLQNKPSTNQTEVRVMVQSFKSILDMSYAVQRTFCVHAFN